MITYIFTSKTFSGQTIDVQYSKYSSNTRLDLGSGTFPFSYTTDQKGGTYYFYIPSIDRTYPKNIDIPPIDIYTEEINVPECDLSGITIFVPSCDVSGTTIFVPVCDIEYELEPILNTCSTWFKAPTTINGNFINRTFTGVLSDELYDGVFCTVDVQIPATDGIRLGYNVFNEQEGPFSYTLLFSIPISNITIGLFGGGYSAGDGCEETFNIVTDVGVPQITSNNYCNVQINNGQLILGPATNEYPDASGIFLIYSDTPFNSLTISGPGGCNGTMIKFCRESIF